MSLNGSNPLSKLKDLNVFQRAKEEVGGFVDTVRSVKDETEEKVPKVYEKLKEEFGAMMDKAKNDGTSGGINDLMEQAKGGINAISGLMQSKKEETEATVEKAIEDGKTDILNKGQEKKSEGTSNDIDENAPAAERSAEVAEASTETKPPAKTEEAIWGFLAKLFEKFCSPTKRD